VDTCDDLYGVRPEGLERQVLPPSEIPQDIAAALSRLDPDEMSFDVTRGRARSSW
jgi:peptidyl-prolyl cis-trans isomerase SurA